MAAARLRSGRTDVSGAETVAKQAEILTVLQNAAARCAQGTEAADCGLRAIKAGCWLHSSSGALPPGWWANCATCRPNLALQPGCSTR